MTCLEEGSLYSPLPELLLLLSQLQPPVEAVLVPQAGLLTPLPAHTHGLLQLELLLLALTRGPLLLHVGPMTTLLPSNPREKQRINQTGQQQLTPSCIKLMKSNFRSATGFFLFLPSLCSFSSTWLLSFLFSPPLARLICI